MTDRTDAPQDAEARAIAELEADAEAWALLAEALPAVTPPRDTRTRLHALLAGRERFAPFASEIAQRFNAPLETVHSALRKVDESDAWLSMPMPGLQVIPVWSNGNGGVVIGKLRAGTRIPGHRHRTRELTYVLDGVLLVNGERHTRAACLDMAEGTEHALDVSPDEDCLVVFASPPPS